MIKKLFTLTMVMLIVFTASSVYAEEMTDNRTPVYTGKIINAGTVVSKNSSNNVLLVDTLDYGVITLKVSEWTEIKMNDTYLNFQDIKVKDSIGFEGYWSGNLVSATDMSILEGAPESYFANTSTPYYLSLPSPTVTDGNTSSKSLASLEIYELVILKG